jgi:hypothetical protein
MAGDWIKMRLDLQTHPKIVRILSATKADKFRVIGGLHAVWSVFDTHSTDGTLPGYTPETLDHIIGWQGFADAMIAVGWLTFDGSETLILPSFDEHNGKSGKRRAEDQRRKREDRRAPQIIIDSSGQIADKNRTREEKRREEKTQAPAEPLPAWVPEKPWADFVEMRRKIKKPMTQAAEKLAIKALDQLRRAGNDAAAVLNQSVMNSWQGLFELKGHPQQPIGAGTQDWLKGAI